MITDDGGDFPKGKSLFFVFLGNKQQAQSLKLSNQHKLT